jgi:hypothetical protein
MNFTSTARKTTLATLRRFAQPQRPDEQCEFCSVGLAPTHRHLLEAATRKIVCACDPCALRFETGTGRWKLIPRDTRRLSGFRMTDAQWEGLSLPINLAFFFRSTPAGKVMAMYPSPAGATESLLPLAAWEALTAENPALAEMQSDVEALLANRLNDQREYYLAPIDTCFELVGLIRMHWRGLSGGEKAWQEIEKFFNRLRETSLAETPREEIHA